MFGLGDIGMSFNCPWGFFPTKTGSLFYFLKNAYTVKDSLVRSLKQSIKMMNEGYQRGELNDSRKL